MNFAHTVRKSAADTARLSDSGNLTPGMILLTGARQWGPALFLGVLAAICWWAASNADTDEVSTKPVTYTMELDTPVLSARRMPRSIQAPIANRQLEPKIQEVVSKSPEASCLLVRSGNRNVGVPHNAEQTVIPASNQKILTTFAALERLDPNFRFRTTVKSLEAPVEGKIEGDLYLVGGGDPYLSTDNWWEQYDDVEGRSHTRFEELADAIVELGVTEIEGDLIGDESLFDSARVGPWATRLIESRQSGPLSALTVNEGFTDWPEVFPGSSASRSPTDNPPLHAVSVFEDLLSQRGVSVNGTSTGKAPDESVVRAAVESPPLANTVTHINSYSSNIGAELLLKQLGSHASGDGTTQAGAEAVVQTLQNSGIAVEDLRIRDGSGLAESGRVTCAALAAVLEAAGPESAFANSMSISGERGSLRTLFVDTPADMRVRAKTGTLNDVLSLSGYIHPEGNGGESILFAYVANGPAAATNPSVREARDLLVLSIAEYPEGPSLNDVSPTQVTPR